MSETKGRLDVFLARLVEEGCKRVEARTGFDFWNGLPDHGQSGMKQIVEDLIDQCGIPRVPVDLPRTLTRAGLAELSELGSDRAKSGEPARSKKRSGFLRPSERARRQKRAHGV